MARKGALSDEAKKDIFEAVGKAKASGAKWSALFETAQTHGWSGGLPYLKQAFRKAGGFTKKYKSGGKGKAVAALAPAKSKALNVAAHANGSTAPAPVSKVSELEALVERLVNERVEARLAAVARLLEQALSECGGHNDKVAKMLEMSR